MKAISLLWVFVLAKVLVLVHRDVPLSLYTPWAYLWQDVVVAFLFAALDGSTRRKRPWIGWSAYALIVLYVAVNVPIACTLATPLTWPMLRAARGPSATPSRTTPRPPTPSAWRRSWRQPPRCRRR